MPAESVGELLDGLLGLDEQLAPLRQLLVKRGNPFFLEETIRTLVETKVLAGERGRYRLTQPVHTIQVPATVQAIIAARIDRLAANDKRLLQVASVIGKDVPLALLQEIADLPEDDLRRGLDHLQAAEFLFETRLFPSHEYTFKHALTHDVTYSSLLQERRHTSHARIVTAIERLHAGRLIEHVERLGHHAFVGSSGTRPCTTSGRRAHAPSIAPRTGRLPATTSRRSRRSRTCRTRARAARRASTFAWRCARRCCRPPSRRASSRTCRQPKRSPPHSAMRAAAGKSPGFSSVHFRNRGAYDEAIAAAVRARSVGTSSGDVILQALAHLFLGAADWAQGDYRRAIRYLDETTAALAGASRYERFGQANLPAVQCRAFLAACHAELGTFAVGQALADEALAIAEHVAHPSSIMWAQYGLGVVALRQGHAPRAVPRLERALGIGQDVNLPLFVPRVAAALSEAYLLAGRSADAEPLLARAIAQTTAPEMRGFQALCRLPLGQAHLLAGRHAEARTEVEQALALAREHGERGNEAYALRLRGEILASDDGDEAERSYRAAMALATELGMRPLIAHCHRGLGTHYRRAGKDAKAREHLAEAAALDHALGIAETAIASVRRGASAS